MQVRYLFVFAFMLLSYNGFAQVGDLPTNNPLKIEAANKLDIKGTEQKGTSLNIPSVIDDEPKIDTDLSQKKNPIQMLPERKLVQAGEGMKIDPKIGDNYDKEGDSQFFGNQYLGDIKNNGKFIGIVCRDHEYVDGDRVKISVNDRVIDANILLTGGFKGVNVDLEKGFNRIEFEALNEGTSSPNTAQVDVYDEEGKLIYSNKWLLSEGSIATFIVTKE
ncbi:hypothetical protein JQC67_01355 [Aurantibacter crassamenti]|uniref:hypothetical protein n=1 Tax=Aurantibacter crassamenti TaxID=1837375 RepID=UPI0019397BD4|nr:hypothetical protein [Aurantibacter crassamenti]MBM1104772.1 hypothetical protein [Aurantibacter crassamenti]